MSKISKKVISPKSSKQKDTNSNSSQKNVHNESKNRTIKSAPKQGKIPRESIKKAVKAVLSPKKKK